MSSRGRDFIEKVARLNVKELVSHPDSYSHAVNSILSIDTLVGQMALKDDGSLNSDQDKFLRNEIAAHSGAYHLIRDAAFSLKHGWLKASSQVRLLRHTDAIFKTEARWNDGGEWRDDLAFSDNVVAVEFDGINGELQRIRADVLAISALEACECHLNSHPIPVPALADLMKRGISGLKPRY